MALLLLVPVLAVSAWVMLTAFRRMRRLHASTAWWFAFGLLATVGFVAGCWLTFSFQYQVSPRLRFAGFPIPLVIFHFEYDQWVDFVTPRSVAILSLIANISAAIAVALSPALLASLVFAGRCVNAKNHVVE